MAEGRWLLKEQETMLLFDQLQREINNGEKLKIITILDSAEDHYILGTKKVAISLKNDGTWTIQPTEVN